MFIGVFQEGNDVNIIVSVEHVYWCLSGRKAYDVNIIVSVEHVYWCLSGRKAYSQHRQGRRSSYASGVRRHQNCPRK